MDEALADWQWSRGYVEDVARAIALAVTDERAAGRTYNVADPTALTEAEWVRQIARVHGWRGEVIALPREKLEPSLRSDAFDLSQQYAVDSRRIRRELGYAEEVPFEEALRRTIEWERANPPDTVAPEQFDYPAEDLCRANATREGSRAKVW